jgi:hypothetical protein
MTTIEFAPDDTTASIEITPDHGDPNAVFRAGPAQIADTVAEHGYRFEDRTGISYQELSRAYRETEKPDHIALGDLSDRIVPVDVQEDDPNPDGDGVTLTLVGPDDERLERTFGAAQNLGAVAAAVTDAYDLDVTDRVVLSPTAGREEPLATDRGVNEFAADTLYWEVAAREE